jgi:hypothetical protein
MGLDPDETFAKNESINGHIHRILNEFSGRTQSRMLKAIRDCRATLDRAGDQKLLEIADAQARHTFREFVVGQYLVKAGFRSLEYSPQLDGKTPDWFDPTQGLVVEVFTNERNGCRIPTERTAHALREKIEKYTSLIRRNRLSFVVGIHGDFLGGIRGEECKAVLNRDNTLLANPMLSGVLYFGEKENYVAVRRQLYDFTFFRSPNCDYPLLLPDMTI